MIPPVDVPELRRVMGLFVVSRRYIPSYAMITKPLTDLLKKQTQWIWGEDQQRAYDVIRDKLLQGVHLAPPNYDLPFHLKSDASEDGKAAVLYQLPEVPIEEQYPYARSR